VFVCANARSPINGSLEAWRTPSEMKRRSETEGSWMSRWWGEDNVLNQHELINLRLAAAIAEDRQRIGRYPLPVPRGYDTIGETSAPSKRSYFWLVERTACVSFQLQATSKRLLGAKRKVVPEIVGRGGSRSNCLSSCGVAFLGGESF